MMLLLNIVKIAMIIGVGIIVIGHAMLLTVDGEPVEKFQRRYVPVLVTVLFVLMGVFALLSFISGE